MPQQATNHHHGRRCLLLSCRSWPKPKPPAESLGLSIPGSVREEQIESMDPHGKNLPLVHSSPINRNDLGLFLAPRIFRFLSPHCQIPLFRSLYGSSNPQKDRFKMILATSNRKIMVKSCKVNLFSIFWRAEAPLRGPPFSAGRKTRRVTSRLDLAERWEIAKSKGGWYLEKYRKTPKSTGFSSLSLVTPVCDGYSTMFQCRREC